MNRFDPADALTYTLVFDTTPVAFGALGIPVTTLATLTNLPYVDFLSPSQSLWLTIFFAFVVPWRFRQWWDVNYHWSLSSYPCMHYFSSLDRGRVSLNAGLWLLSVDFHFPSFKLSSPIWLVLVSVGSDISRINLTQSRIFRTSRSYCRGGVSRRFDCLCAVLETALSTWIRSQTVCRVTQQGRRSSISNRRNPVHYSIQ